MDPDLGDEIEEAVEDDWDTSYYDADGVYHWQCETCGEWDGNCFGPWDDE